MTGASKPEYREKAGHGNGDSAGTMPVLVTATEMQELDRMTMEEFGVPGVVLMENAGRSTFMFMEEILGTVRGRAVIVFVGPGNNGGDGLVVARHVFQAGGRPFLVYGGDPAKLKGDAAINQRVVERLSLETVRFDPDRENDLVEQLLALHGHTPVLCLVDSLFGTGLSREIGGRYASLVNLINRLRARFHWPVLAVDLPSGLNSDTGQVLGCAVRADLTATYGLAKAAHFHHGSPAIGRLRVVDIGIPPQAVARVAPPGSLINGTVLARIPNRSPASHKGSHGHLLVLGGCTGMTGACILACRAALRSGCGLVSAAVPQDLNPVFESSLTEAMTIALPRSLGRLDAADHQEILRQARARDAVVLGPGMGTATATAQLVLSLIHELELPMVVDADGLNILAARGDQWSASEHPRVLTPHPGEMARLLASKTSAVQKDRIRAALELARRSGPQSVAVLKGAGTVVAAADGRWAVNTTGNPGMATGGMGDVLSGLIGGLLARGMDPWSAACAGVYAHGLAADLLARKTAYGFSATEVAEMLPHALTSQDKENPSC